MAVDPKTGEVPPVEPVFAGAGAAVPETPVPTAAVNDSEAVELAAGELALEPMAAACTVLEPLAAGPAMGRPAAAGPTATGPAETWPAETGPAATGPAETGATVAEPEAPELVALEPEAPGFEAPEPVFVEAAVTGFELGALARVTPVESPAGGFPVGELTPGASPTGLIAFLMPVTATSFADVLGDGVLREVASAGPNALEGVTPPIGTPTGLEVPADVGMAR